MTYTIRNVASVKARTSGRPSVAATDRGITSRVAATAVLGCNTQYSLSEREIDPKKEATNLISNKSCTQKKKMPPTPMLCKKCSGTFAPNACFEMAPCLPLQG